MPCCSRKKTVGTEPQIISNMQSDESIKTLSPSSEIDYIIRIKTSDLQGSGTDGPVYIKIFGHDGKQTDELLLSSLFQENSLQTIQIKTIDIGKPQRIFIRHEDITKGWFLIYVEISVHDYLIRFVANRWLNQSKYDRKLIAELFSSEQPAIDYDIEIRTGIEQIEPLDTPVYIQIYGNITSTPKIFLESINTTFARNSIEKFHISNNNVGQIQKIIIGHENLGTINDWYLEQMKLKTIDQEYEFSIHQWLSPTKGNQQLFIELTPQSSRSSSPTLETYFITTKIIDVHHTNAIDRIQMSIVGSNGHIDNIYLRNILRSNEREMFQKGCFNQFELNAKDIGNRIESITIGFDDPQQQAALLIDSININYKNKVYRFSMQYWLSSRLGENFSWTTIQPDGYNQNNIHYQIIIDTNESTTDSNIILCIYGENGTTKCLALRRTKDGLPTQFDIKMNDIGKIKKINIGHDGHGNEKQWYLKSIEIQKNNEHYQFQANRWFNETMGTFADLFLEESKPISPRKDEMIYKITIVTNSKNDSGTDSGVFMTIYGDKDQTKQFQLINTKHDSDLLFKPGEKKQFQIELNDVGNINKINIGQDGKGLHPSWHLDTVIIEKGSEIFKFHANQILDYSTLDIDLTPILPDDSKSLSSQSITSKKENKLIETTYQISAWFRSLSRIGTHKKAPLYLIIIGEYGRTKKLFLPTDKKDLVEFTAVHVGKISKILLGQEKNSYGTVWYVDHLVIRRENETIRFYIEQSISQDNEIEVCPSSSEISTNVMKRKDTNYEIKTTTGNKTFDGEVTIKIRGDSGLIAIPLSKPEGEETPFQAKAIDTFTTRTTDVGKIKRCIIEINATESNQEWFLKKIQIFKGVEVYHFNTNIHLDWKGPKVTLYPIAKPKEDYVQTELRRLRENLRCESAKMRRPPHKPHEPYVYNDLSPYFDTSTVEKAIQAPTETPPGYYTRLTALRVVEPWEAHGMDYAVNYELLKHRAGRGRSARRSAKKFDENIDRTQGSTHCPEFHCVNVQTPAEYHRPLTLNDVPKIRSLIRDRYSAKSTGQLEKEYQRTRNDFYRMQLDNVAGYNENKRENLLRTYRSYLQNTPGSRKALRDLCEQIPINATKTTVEGTV